VALQLERIGDVAVDVGEATQSVASLPGIPEVLHRLQDMGRAATSMTELAVDAFRGRDREMCERLPELDDRIDELDREMASHVLAHSEDPERLEWALRMLPASRTLTRAADHAGHRRAGVVPGDRRAAEARLSSVAGSGPSTLSRVMVTFVLE
jgi:phosphate uptake regulator